MDFEEILKEWLANLLKNLNPDSSNWGGDSGLAIAPHTLVDVNLPFSVSLGIRCEVVAAGQYTVQYGAGGTMRQFVSLGGQWVACASTVRIFYTPAVAAPAIGSAHVGIAFAAPTTP